MANSVQVVEIPGNADCYVPPGSGIAKVVEVPSDGRYVAPGPGTVKVVEVPATYLPRPNTRCGGRTRV